MAERTTKIGSHFLASSPPGQVADVEKDVLVLVGEAGMSESALQNAHKVYNQKNMVPIRISASAGAPVRGVVLSTAEGSVERDGLTFLVDSNRKQLVEVNQRAGTGIVAAGAAPPSTFFSTPQEPLRAAIASAMSTYASRAYNAAGIGSTPWERGTEAYANAETGGVTILTSVTVRNLSNFWSGCFLGRYQLTGQRLTGTVRIVTHYFESGNTQMHSEKAISPVELPSPSASAAASASGGGSGDPNETLAKSIAKAICAAEDELQSSLDLMLDSISSTALKELRRVLPMSATKMNWNAAAHRLAKTVGAQGNLKGGVAAAPIVGGGKPGAPAPSSR